MILAQAISRVVLFCRPHPKTPAFFRTVACAVLAAVCLSSLLANATVVRMEISFGNTPAGNIDIELYDDRAPLTVANFLRYAGQRKYDNSIIHRSDPGFIIQGGGHTYLPNPVTGQPTFFKIPPDAPIQNEFSSTRPNIRRAIAMAKFGGQPDSATSEWYFNLADNTSLDNPGNNGGYTVFGEVIAGMNVVDEIATLNIFDGANKYPFYYPCNPDPIQGWCRNPTYFLELPTTNYDTKSYINGDSTTYLQVNNLVYVTRIPNVRSTRTELGTLATFTADVDMVFDDVQTVATNTALTWLTSFPSPPDQSAQFNNGMFTLKMSGPMDANGRIVTLYDGATNRPTRYYVYGKTLDNQTDHWYDFAFDGVTGAEIKNDRIILHFVDGQRGDEDLTANNSITHTGAQAVVTTTSSTSSAQSGGCSIATTPSKTPRGGDWVMVSLFLGMLALVRRRARRQVQHERVTNIASP